MKIVVVNWNHSDVLRRNLANLQGEGLLDSVVVVDNGSTDDSVRVAQEYNVELMALPSNVGYGAANDIAMKSTSDDVALLLNSEVVSRSKLKVRQQHRHQVIVLPRVD